MFILGKHSIPTDKIRELAIKCHALDLSADKLFQSFPDFPAERNTELRKYNELFSSALLELAISVRMHFYQGASSKLTDKFIINSGFYDELEDGE